MEKDAQDKYLDAYANEEIMKSGFEYYRALPQDIDDNIEFLKKGKLTYAFSWNCRKRRLWKRN